jgi:hypothetical protein
MNPFNRVSPKAAVNQPVTGASRQLLGAISNRVPQPVRIAAGVTLVLAALCSGCVVPGGGGGDGGDVSYGYGVNFYEPFDNNGYWGPGYLVGPPRGGESWRHDGPGRERPYHGAQPDHPMPSIPHGHAGDGNRGGSGRGGGPGGGGGSHDQHH